jgi:hypothetical protein
MAAGAKPIQGAGTPPRMFEASDRKRRQATSLTTGASTAHEDHFLGGFRLDD